MVKLKLPKNNLNILPKMFAYNQQKECSNQKTFPSLPNSIPTAGSCTTAHPDLPEGKAIGAQGPLFETVYCFLHFRVSKKCLSPSI